MKNLFNFFFSFDKLMKEGLVRGFFWLALINIGLVFFARMFGAVKLTWLAAPFSFFQFFVQFLLAVVILRLLSEVAIAIFRINDNLSPDGGKSETADIDPVAETRRAAEQAAKRASELSKTAVDKTSAATKSAGEKTKATFDDVTDKVADVVPGKKTSAKTAATTSAKDITIEPDAPAKVVKKAAPKTTAAKKPAAAKKAAASKTTAKKTSTASKTTAKKTTTKATTAAKKVTLNKDGTPRKIRTTKPKS